MCVCVCVGIFGHSAVRHFLLCDVRLHLKLIHKQETRHMDMLPPNVAEGTFSSDALFCCPTVKAACSLHISSCQQLLNGRTGMYASVSVTFEN